MADSHLAGKKVHLRLIEDLGHKTVSLDPMKTTFVVYGNDTATLLSSVLKSMKAIVSKACCIFNSIDTKYATLVVQLVISIILTIAHFLFLINPRLTRGIMI
jgi:hypothetical protein